MHQENYIELHFLPELLPYYLWIFPLPNGVANVGVGMYSDKIRREKINLKELMIHAIQNNSSIKSRFTNATLIGKIQGYGLPIFSKEATISGDHFLLVGDAAHLIDPFTGEGIGNALYSGMKAADAVKSCLESNQFHSQFIKAHYEEPLYQRMKSELRTSLTLHRLCRHKWLFNLITRKAAKSPALAKMISSMMSDIDLRSHLNNPFFYLRIILNL
jgi:flavin-dependent dehydrogenase